MGLDFQTAFETELEGILPGKIHPVFAFKGTKPPYIVYRASEGVPYKSLDGYMDLNEVPVEIDILHYDQSGLRQLVKSVTQLIRSFEGRNIGADGPFIQEITYETPIELYETEVDWYRTNISMRVYF